MLLTKSGQKPKILIIPTYDTYGGTLTFFLKLLKFHQNNQMETAVLIPENQTYPDILEIFGTLQIEVYKSTSRPNLFFKPYFSLLYDITFCWKAYWSFRPDLIFVSSGAHDLMLGILLYPVPVIFAVHTTPPPEVKNKKRVAMRLFTNFLCRFGSKLFLTVSQFSARSIHNYMGVPADYIQVIHNSYRSDLVKEIGLKQRIVLTIGHVVGYKNPEVWLSVAKKVLLTQPDVQFVWLGDGISLSHIRQEVSQSGLEEKIILPGYRSNVDAYYNKAIIYFQPSLVESHGIAVVEAMAHGLPCVVSNIGGLPESVSDSETGFTCAPDDVDSFSTRILQLLTDFDLRNKMGQSGQQRAEHLFSEVVQERKILDLYQSLLMSGETV